MWRPECVPAQQRTGQRSGGTACGVAPIYSSAAYNSHICILLLSNLSCVVSLAQRVVTEQCARLPRSRLRSALRRVASRWRRTPRRLVALRRLPTWRPHVWRLATRWWLTTRGRSLSLWLLASASHHLLHLLDLLRINAALHALSGHGLALVLSGISSASSLSGHHILADVVSKRTVFHARSSEIRVSLQQFG